MSNPLLTLIKTQIVESGPLSVADYMELCLSHPEHGYYMKHTPFGREGDFVTSPEVSQIFGEMLGLWCADVWSQLHGLPKYDSARWQLVEMGPGRGTLMKDALRASKALPGFHEAVSVQMIETSPRLANEQYHLLKGAHPRIQWIDRIEQLPKQPILLIANELFDALPIKQFVQSEQGLVERKVGWNEAEEKLEFVTQAAGLSLAKSDGESSLPVGAIVESCPAAREVMAALSEHIKTYGGAALIVDYGYIGPAQADTLQAMKAHSFAGVLDDPGNADLTAHVSFKALAEVAQGKGLRTHGPATQGEFLTRIGAELRAQKLMKSATPEQSAAIISGLQRIIAPEQMGVLFKAMAVSGDMELVASGF